MTSGETHPEVRRVTARAIRRLNALEYVILGVTMLLALLAGALVSRMVEMMTGEASRLAWAVSSLLFFIVPGWVVLKREREADRVRERAADAGSGSNAVRLEGITDESDNGGR